VAKNWIYFKQYFNFFFNLSKNKKVAKFLIRKKFHLICLELILEKESGIEGLEPKTARVIMGN
jgi:hypothetical protein